MLTLQIKETANAKKLLEIFYFSKSKQCRLNVMKKVLIVHHGNDSTETMGSHQNGKDGHRQY